VSDWNRRIRGRTYGRENKNTTPRSQDYLHTRTKEGTRRKVFRNSTTLSSSISFSFPSCKKNINNKTKRKEEVKIYTLQKL